MSQQALYTDTLPLDVKKSLEPLVRARRVQRNPDILARSETNARDALTRLRIRHILPVIAKFIRIVEDDHVEIEQCDESDTIHLYTGDDRGYVLLDLLCDYVGDFITHLLFRRDCVPIEYAKFVKLAMPNVQHLQICWYVPKVSDRFPEEKANYPNLFLQYKALELDAMLDACPNLNDFQLSLFNGNCTESVINVLSKYVHRFKMLRLTFDKVDMSLQSLWRATTEKLGNVVVTCNVDDSNLELHMLSNQWPNCSVVNASDLGNGSS